MKKQTEVRKKYMPKYIEESTKGHCPFCHKPVKSLEAHVNAKHKEKIVKHRKMSIR